MHLNKKLIELDYRQLVDKVALVFFVLDKAGKIVVVNKKAIDVLGYEENELLDKNWFDIFVSKKDAKRIKDSFTKFVDQKILLEDCYRNKINTKKGEERTFCWHSDLVKDEKETVLYAACWGEDITEKIIQENALKENEERYRLLSDNLMDVVFTMDLNQKFTFLSPSIYSMTGYSVEEVLKLPLKKILSSASYKAASAMLNEELSKEMVGKSDLRRSGMIELELMSRKDAKVWCEVKVSFLRDVKDKAIGIIGVARDVSEKKFNREALNKTNWLIQAIFQASPLSIIAFDKNNIVKMWNGASEKMFGWQSEKVIGKPLPTIIKEDKELSNAIFARVLKGEHINYEATRQKKDKSIVEISSHVAPIKDENGKINGSALSFHNLC